MEKYDIVKFVDNDFELDVRTDKKNETVWLSQKEMALLFAVSTDNVGLHIKNIIAENELDDSTTEESSVVQIEGNRKVTRKIKIYNLDMIISVGYRVKSQRGIIFRRWANKVLKEYLIQGYSINNKRLENLNKVIDIQNKMLSSALNIDNYELSEVIKTYTNALDLLDDYDHRTVKKINGNISNKKIDYKECMNIINTLKFNEESNLFALERNKGLEAIIGDIYQTFDGIDVYKSLEEKAANFLYMVVKNHVFIDGNKRIAATLFIYFLQFYNILYKDNQKTIDNNTLTALTLLIAESNPKEKDIIVDLVINFLI